MGRQRSYFKRTGTKDGRIVAIIHKLKNHTQTSDGNWQVEVGGKLFLEMFREVKKAQEFAAEKAL
jgi:hypothetical protein